MKKSYYFLSILILFLININCVNATTYLPEEYDAQLYDNSNGNLTSVTTQFNSHSGGSWFYGYIPMVANSSGGAWGITSPVIFTSGHTYTFSARVFTGCGKVKLSSYNRIGIGTNLSDAVSNYTNNRYVNEINSDYNTYNYIQFAFESQIDGTYLVFPFSAGASSSNCEIQMTTISITDLGDSGVTEEQINQSFQNQTNEINNSISQSTNDIKGSISNTEDSINSNIDDMESSINSNIKENFNNCYKNLFNITDYTDITYMPNGNATIRMSTDNAIIISSGNAYSGFYIQPSYLSNYIDNFNPDTEYTMSFDVTVDNNVTLQYGMSNKKTTSVSSGTTRLFVNTTAQDYSMVFYATRSNANQNIKISNIMISDNNYTDYIKYGKEVCSNKIDQTNDKLDNVNDSINDLNSSINDSNTSGASGEASDFFSNFSTDTFGLTSVITAPLELIKSVTSKTCTPLHGTLPFVDSVIDLPCLTTIYESHFGSFLTIYRTITFGFVSYWVCIRIFNLVKDFKNPEHDEIEVLDL